MNIDPHYYGKGKIYLALITAGVVGASVWIGDVSAFSIKSTTQKVEHKESYSGKNALTDSFVTENAITVDMTLHQISPANLARVLYGSVTSTDAGTFTGKSLGAAVVAGDEISLGYLSVSDVVITDSAGTPATLVEGTDYTVDPTFGRVTILDVGSYTQPFLAAGAFDATQAVGMFTAGQQKYALRYEGVNLAEGNTPVVVDLYKVAPDPLQELALITSGTDVAGMQVSSGVLLDTSKPATGGLGQFGSITQLAAV